MFAHDPQTDVLTFEGRPVDDLLRKVFDLIAEGDPIDVDMFEWDFEREWTSYEVPGSDRTLYLPDFLSSEWGQWVETIDSWQRTSHEDSPFACRAERFLCCVDDIYFLVDDGPKEIEVTVIGVDALDEARSAPDWLAEDEQTWFEEQECRRQYEEEYYAEWGFHEDKDATDHEVEDLGTHAVFRHWKSSPEVFWAPTWHADSEGLTAAHRAFDQLVRWGAPKSATGAYVAAMGDQCVALDGAIILRVPREDPTLADDIEGALVIGPELLRVVCDIAGLDAPDFPDAPSERTLDELYRTLAWQLDSRRNELGDRLERIRKLQGRAEARAFAVEFAAELDRVMPDGPISPSIELVEDLGMVSVHDALTPAERFECGSVEVHVGDVVIHGTGGCGRTNYGVSDRELTRTRMPMTELRKQRSSLCRGCGGSLKAALAALESVEASGPPLRCLALDLSVKTSRCRTVSHCGDDVIAWVLGTWTWNENPFDPVFKWISVSGVEATIVTRYWAEMAKHGLVSAIARAVDDEA